MRFTKNHNRFVREKYGRNKNIQGQFHLDDILTHPNSKVVIGIKGDIQLFTPYGRGAHFRSDNSFKGFLNYE